MTLAADIQTLEPGAKVELFEVDATVIGGDIARFHGYMQVGSIYWQGNTYSPWPIQAEGWEITTDQPPIPTLSVGNVDSSISALCLAYDDMLGAVVTRHQVFAKYLDAANFPDGNPSADPTQESPPDVWVIERKATEDYQTVVFELSNPTSVMNAQLPGRQIIAGGCPWLAIGGYRGPYCGYNGPPVAKIDDTPTSDLSQDACGGRVSSCKLRFGANNQLPYGGFPAAQLTNTQ